PPSQDAMQRHQAAGVADRIQYRSIDTLEIPYKNEFDIVLFKSVLGALGCADSQEGRARQARAVAQMYQALRSGGELFFAENLVASPFHQFFRRRFVQWGTRWRYVSIQEMNDYLSPFSRVQYRTLAFAGTFGRTEAQRNFLGTLDQAMLN